MWKTTRNPCACAGLGDCGIDAAMYDAIIVGAGPSGASAAIALAQKGVRNVLLLDRAHFPRDKTCGSGLSPNALKLGGELGIDAELRRLAAPVMPVRRA